MEFTVTMCKIKLRRKLRKLMPTLDGRISLFAINSYRTIGVMMYENKAERAKKLLK